MKKTSLALSVISCLKNLVRHLFTIFLPSDVRHDPNPKTTMDLKLEKKIKVIYVHCENNF